MRKTLPLLLAVMLLAVTACGTGTPSPAPPSPTVPAAAAAPSPKGDWWQQAVFYEIFVRSFYDSNGDGIGDFQGIIEKLDYLNDGDPATHDDLGVRALWLMPIFPSPSYHGYDVTDYYSVNPQYGTLDDFRRLLDEAHRRGMRVIIDLVINHTSDQHPWFRQARSDPQSPYRGWYIWAEDDPGYQGPWGEPVWHRAPTGYYYGVFTAQMPDLNYANPEVTAEMQRVAAFWLNQVGVDGFRLDAAKHLIERNTWQENTPETHAWLADFTAYCKSIRPDALLVGEVFGADSPTVNAYTDGELDLVFHFTLAQAFIESARRSSALPTLGQLNTAARALPEGQFATFLTNHDQNRVMSELEGSTLRAKVAASLLLTAPGVPFLYYGEEIGMQGVKPDEDIRRPMQWSAAPNAGFTGSRPWRAPAGDYTFVNVAAQSHEANSLLSHYRNLIQTRNAHPALQEGAFAIVKSGRTDLFAALRAAPQEAALVLVNLSAAPLDDYTLKMSASSLPPHSTCTLSAAYGQSAPLTLETDAEGGFVIDNPPPVPGYSTLILTCPLP